MMWINVINGAILKWWPSSTSTSSTFTHLYADMTVVVVICLTVYDLILARDAQTIFERFWIYTLDRVTPRKNVKILWKLLSCHLPTRKYVHRNMLVFIHLTDTSKSDNELLSSDKIMTAIYLNNIHRVGQVTYIRINSRDLRVWVCG